MVARIRCLQPQSVGLLAQLLRGELHACGRTPALLVVEGCSKAKVGGPRVRDAMLGAHTHSRVGPNKQQPNRVEPDV